MKLPACVLSIVNASFRAIRNVQRCKELSWKLCALWCEHQLQQTISNKESCVLEYNGA
jgi:hypothetical protein